MPSKKKAKKPEPVDIRVRGEWYQLDPSSPSFRADVAICAAIETRNGTCDQLLNMALRDHPLMDVHGEQIWPRNA